MNHILAGAAEVPIVASLQTGYIAIGQLLDKTVKGASILIAHKLERSPKGSDIHPLQILNFCIERHLLLRIMFISFRI
jgi:hypothetical protein